MFGMPTAFPYPAIPFITSFAMYLTLFLFLPFGLPNLNGSAIAITFAPMQRTSLIMPPTPVAAPS